jgi:hypothetical protein
MVQAVLLFLSLLSLFPFGKFVRENNKTVFSEKNRIISIEAENGSLTPGWVTGSYYTGRGIFSKINNYPDSLIAEYDLEFIGTGEYDFFVLGNGNGRTEGDNSRFSIQLYDNNRNLIGIKYLVFPILTAPSWGAGTPDSEKQVSFIISTPGRYTLRVENPGLPGLFLDKFVFTSDLNYRPEGTGPVETSPEGAGTERNRIILPPRWAFGILYGAYTNQKESLRTVDSLIQGDYPIDAYWIDSYFWDFNSGKGPGGYVNFIGDTAAFPDMEAMWTEFAAKKIKAGIWIWNLINENGNEAAFADFKESKYFTDTYLNTGGWHNKGNNTITGSINFDDPEAVVYWKSRLKPFFDKGLDFLKLDNSSDISFCSAAFSATQELGKETEGRGFILAHLHSTWDYRHKSYPAKWTGDAKICWSQPDYPDLGVYAMGGLRENIGMIADPKRSTYEIPFLTHDAGGYDYFGSTDQSDELYMRWMQFASMNTMMSIFSTAKNPTRNHPYRYPEYVQENFRKYTHLRMKLFPYIYSYAVRTYLTGEKMIQGDGIHEYQYRFGDELLVAPVYRKGQTSQDVYFPQGKWYDTETDSVFEGGGILTVYAPQDKLPLFAREGAIIPMRRYARALELGNNDTLEINVWPAEKASEFTLYEDDGISNAYLEGKYSAITMRSEKIKGGMQFTVDPVQGDFKGMKPDRSYEISFRCMAGSPTEVRINGAILREVNGNDSYGYYEKNNTLLVKFTSVKKEKTVITVKQ